MEEKTTNSPSKVLSTQIGVERDSIADTQCLKKGKERILRCKNTIGLRKSDVLLSGGFAMNRYSWTNRRFSW